MGDRRSKSRSDKTSKTGFWHRAKSLANRYIGIEEEELRKKVSHNVAKADHSKQFDLLNLQIDMLEKKLKMLEDLAIENKDKQLGNRTLLQVDEEIVKPKEEYFEESSEVSCCETNSMFTLEGSLSTSYPIHFNSQYSLDARNVGIAINKSCTLTMPFIYNVSCQQSSQEFFENDEEPVCTLTYNKETRQIVIDYRKNKDAESKRICINELGDSLELVQAEIVGRVVCYLLGIFQEMPQTDTVIFEEAKEDESLK